MGLSKKKLEVEQSLHKKKYNKNSTKIQQKSHPSEALGLSTYTNEATNNFLKIREAWLPKLEIVISYPPLVRLPANA